MSFSSPRPASKTVLPYFFAPSTFIHSNHNPNHAARSTRLCASLRSRFRKTPNSPPTPPALSRLFRRSREPVTTHLPNLSSTSPLTTPKHPRKKPRSLPKHALRPRNPHLRRPLHPNPQRRRRRLGRQHPHHGASLPAFKSLAAERRNALF